MDGQVRELLLDVADGKPSLGGGVSEHGDTSPLGLDSGAAKQVRKPPAQGTYQDHTSHPMWSGKQPHTPKKNSDKYNSELWNCRLNLYIS